MQLETVRIYFYNQKLPGSGPNSPELIWLKSKNSLFKYI